jgi:hypothetical protein
MVSFIRMSANLFKKIPARGNEKGGSPDENARSAKLNSPISIPFIAKFQYSLSLKR